MLVFFAMLEILPEMKAVYEKKDQGHTEDETAFKCPLQVASLSLCVPLSQDEK